MAYKRLWVFLEGNDDERFFTSVIKPIFDDMYDFVKPWLYAQKKPTKARDFLRSIKSMGSNYFFWADINSFPCVTAKKKSVTDNYGPRLDADNIMVVIRKIESWYLAGLTERGCKKLGVRAFRNTDNITKEKLEGLMPGKFDSRIDFMVEMLKSFSVNTARQKNKSFAYLMSRL